MDSLERFSAAIHRDRPDRVPLAYQFFGAANNVLNALQASLREIYYTPKGVAAFQLKAKELYGHDNVMIPGGCCIVEAEAMGAKIIISEKDYPKIISRQSKDLSELVVADPYEAGRIPVYLESINLLSKQLDQSTPIIGMIIAPLGVLTELHGFSEIIVDFHRDPDKVHEALRVVTQTCIAYGVSMLKEGAHGIMVDDASASETIMSPELCAELDIQYTKQLVDAVKAAGGFIIIHNCSKKPYLKQQVDLKPDVLNISGGNLRAIKEQYGKRVCLMGNIEPNMIEWNSTIDVQSKAIECVKELKNEGGFIFSTGCEIPHNAPVANVKVLKEIVEQYGKY